MTINTTILNTNESHSTLITINVAAQTPVKLTSTMLNIKLNLDGQGSQPPAATDQPPATSCMPPSHHRPQPPSHLKVELSCFEFVYK